MSGQLGGPGEVERRQAGARLSGLQVLLHRVRETVVLRTVTQLSTGLVDLEGVAHSYAPHLEVEVRAFVLNMWSTKCSHQDRNHLQKLLLQRSPDQVKGHTAKLMVQINPNSANLVLHSDSL